MTVDLSTENLNKRHHKTRHNGRITHTQSTNRNTKGVKTMNPYDILENLNNEILKLENQIATLTEIYNQLQDFIDGEMQHA